ncbi:MAG: amino acid permease [Candidatus Korarchaeota archaeon]|nr:amino acid permease [Candidatus Korarchaeota archaeon]NIU83037.1 amino acid permease [Candidatus Thorarchaeota archaeon]NIW15149.1 amino acid permease [Candidatus Thorarchaeota archaeon]NIW51576.1 amino acid permease [Candidatus Korarchaeota archaeon]
MSEISTGPSELKRELGLGMLIAIGVGGTVGASIFTITGFAAGMAGPSMILAFLIGGGLTVLIGLNYSELSSTFPESGGGYTFAKKAYGGMPAFLTGWLMAFSNIVFGSLSALGFAHIIGFVIDASPLVHIPIAMLVLAIFAYLNSRGMEESGRIQLILVVILIVGFSVFILSSLTSISASNFSPFMPNGWGGVFEATAFVYVSYFGFETIATVSGEVEQPGKNLVLATLLAVLICTIIYTLVGYVAVGTVNWIVLGESESPLMLTGEKALGQTGILLIGVLGSIGTLTSTNTALIASTRILYALSRDKLLPEGLSKTGAHNTPIYATITATILMGIFTATGVVDLIAHVADFNLFLALIFVNLSVLFLRKKRGVLKRPFKSHTLIAVGGSGVLILLVGFLSNFAIAIGSAIVIMGILIYLFRISPPRTFSLTLGGISAAAGLTLLASLWLGKWNVLLSIGRYSIHTGTILILGSLIQLIVAIVCVFPLGRIIHPEKGMVNAHTPRKDVKFITLLKNALSLLLIIFAILSLFIFYAIFHDFVIFPSIQGFSDAYSVLLSFSLVSFSFSAVFSGLFLFRRKYVSPE